MPTQHWKGVTVPSVGDDLLDAWPAAFDTAGIYIPCASVAAARTILAAAIAAGHIVTSATPAMFLVGSGPNRVTYIADGSQSGGAYRLSPINETKITTVANQWSGAKTLTANQRINLSVAPMDPVGYDRAVDAVGTSYGSEVSGVVHLGILIQGSALSLARFDSGDNVSQSVVNAGVIPAGESPSVILCLYGGALLSDATLNRFVVKTYPVSMA